MLERVIITTDRGILTKGSAMLRNSDHVEGGPGDPRTGREWWGYFKGWPLRVLLGLLAFFLFAVVMTLIQQATDFKMPF